MTGGSPGGGTGYPDSGIVGYPQVGAGWAFPVRWAADGTLARSAGEQRIREAILLVLRSGLGSRVMRPGFGAGVDRYVFDPRTDDVCRRLESDVRRALLLSEPRILLDRIEASPAGPAGERIDVLIEFRVDRHRRPNSLVLPFELIGTGDAG